MALLTINGIAMPEPSKYSVPMKDIIADTLVNELGDQFRSRVKADVINLDVAWMATSENAQIILSAITPDKVKVEYFDPRVNNIRTAIMAVSDRSCELVLFKGNNMEGNMWSIGFSLSQLGDDQL